jgi:fibronectin type 3 domain-containing protein
VAGDQTATLTWNVVVGASSYNVYRGALKVATVAGNTYTDSLLTNGVAYTYTVTCIKSSVESAASTAVQVTPFVITPAAPTGLTATAGNAQVAVSWSPTANATGYKLYRGATLIATQAGTSFVDSGLANGATVTYTVVATNGSASSPASAAVSATPMAPAPTAPTGLTATAGNAQVALSWTAVPTATSYRIYRNNVLLTTVTTTSYTNTGLTNATAYSYYVTAVAATTEGPASTTVLATPTKPLVNGTFTGAIASIASGHGTIRVVIVVTNSVITSSKGTLLTNDGAETVKINTNALPQYDTKAVAAQSAAITKVSSATLTLAAYKTSLQSALTQAGL